MRQLITAVIAGSIVVALLALFWRTGTREDDLAVSITQMVETSR